MPADRRPPHTLVPVAAPATWPALAPSFSIEPAPAAPLLALDVGDLPSAIVLPPPWVERAARPEPY